MPELPEVETVRRGADTHLRGRRLEAVELRRHDLRWPIPVAAVHDLCGRTCLAVSRRAKYLLLAMDGPQQPVALIHLGMTGRLLVEVRANADPDPPWRQHEHWRFHFRDRCVRFVDPRRFGALDVCPAASLADHALLRRLGREPLQPDFDAGFLHSLTRGRKSSIKQVLMDAHLLVGVGNIYASEACHRARVRPRRAAGSLSRTECAELVAAIRAVLEAAIAAGGTSFRDYVGVTEDAGYFARELQVYDRAGQPCRRCGTTVRRTVDGQRSTFWCAGCQR